MHRPRGGTNATEDVPLVPPKTTVGSSGSETTTRRRLFARSCTSLIGPGMIVSLADTDAACLIVAADSGARWGYSLLLLQLLLIPVLFMAQELTVRLGVHTRRGHTACIKERFGRGWAWFTCGVLVLSCVGATVSEMSGVASVGELWGLGRVASTAAASLVLVGVVVGGTYAQVEAVGIVLGLFECTFILTMIMARPSPLEVLEGLGTMHTDPGYLKLVAANIGAVIMPWMIYFQQSAIVAKGLTSPEAEAKERTDTLAGALLTQLIMISTLVTMAATRGVTHTVALRDVSEMAAAMSVMFGPFSGKVLLSLGLAGGSLCAAFVVALAAAWGVCEARQDFRPNSLDLPVREVPHFYGCYLAVVLLGAAILSSGADVVELNTAVMLADAMLMPVTLWFLFSLASGPELPAEVRLRGWHKALCAVLFVVCSAFALGTSLLGLRSR